MIEWIKAQLHNGKPDWYADKSIFQIINNHVLENGKLSPDLTTLPDEEQDESELKFAPGLMDALLGSSDDQAAQDSIERLIQLTINIAKKGHIQSKSEFYQVITENSGVIGIIDNYLEQLVSNQIPVKPYMIEFSHELATKTNHRNAVKFGIALIGLCRDESYLNDVQLMGLHDEFTLFATVAIANISKSPAQDLWELAKKVDGWGRIQSVERLAAMELNEEIKEWLVLEGYKNSIMHQYLALICAESGELNERLKSNEISDELHSATRDILKALMDEGPVQGMSGYEDSLESITNYLWHLNSASLNISDYVVLQKMKQFLEDNLEENDELVDWTTDNISNCLIEVDTLINSNDWKDEINRALRSSVNQEYWDGKEAAQALGMDIREFLWERLEQNPKDPIAWFDITNTATAKEIDRVVQLAETSLPLEFLGSGPKKSLGTGKDFLKHTSFGDIISLLRDYPSKGEKLILTALNSPVIGNRNTVIRTLAAWGRDNWSKHITDQLEYLQIHEPDDNCKKNVIELLSGSKGGEALI